MHVAVRGRKTTVSDSFPPLGWCCGNFISFLLPLHGSPASRCSRLLIGLLLCIGVRVIGYFTRVRVELVEGKGQATRLSLSCTALIHQLLSGTRGAAAALSRHFVKPHPGLPGKSINTWFYSAAYQPQPEGFTAPIKSTGKRSVSDGRFILETLMFVRVVGEGDASRYRRVSV